MKDRLCSRVNVTFKLHITRETPVAKLQFHEVECSLYSFIMMALDGDINVLPQSTCI